MVVKEEDKVSFFGFHELGSSWANEANESFINSGDYSLPDGVS